MSTAVLCVGKMKEKPYREMADEYLKRLSRFGKYEEIEVPDLPESTGSAALEEQVRTREGGFPENRRTPRGWRGTCRRCGPAGCSGRCS